MPWFMLLLLCPGTRSLLLLEAAQSDDGDQGCCEIRTRVGDAPKTHIVLGRWAGGTGESDEEGFDPPEAVQEDRSRLKSAAGDKNDIFRAGTRMRKPES